MAANAETIETPNEPAKNAEAGADKADEKGIKTFFNDAREQLEKLWTDTFGTLNERFQTTEGEVLEFVKRVELEGRGRLNKILEALKLDKWSTANAKDILSNPTKLRDEIVEQGQNFAQGSVNTLGLVTEAQFKTLTDEVAKLSDAIDKLAKQSTGATKKSVTDLAKRVKTLEDAVKKPAKKAVAKKPAAKKTAAKKPAAKKAATKK